MAGFEVRKPKKTKNSTPEDWTLYSDFGQIIEGTRILPCRVPLRSGIRAEFTPSLLVSKAGKLGALRMVIDLTDTLRYYDGQAEFIDAHGIAYRKIRCPGACVPPDYVSQEFAAAMADFERDFGHEEEALVAVHCTHGVNRTGFMVVRWLIEVKGWDLDTALEAFATARGHPIAKVSSLRQRPRATPGVGECGCAAGVGEGGSSGPEW